MGINSYKKPHRHQNNGAFLFAVTGGFEPPSPVSKTAGLANQWFQPLTHVTGCSLHFHATDAKDKSSGIISQKEKNLNRGDSIRKVLF